MFNEKFIKYVLQRTTRVQTIVVVVEVQIHLQKNHHFQYKIHHF